MARPGYNVLYIENAGRGDAVPTSTYGETETPQLMGKYYNDRVTRNKATAVVVACGGGRDGF